MQIESAWTYKLNMILSKEHLKYDKHTNYVEDLDKRSIFGSVYIAQVHRRWRKIVITILEDHSYYGSKFQALDNEIEQTLKRPVTLRLA